MNPGIQQLLDRLLSYETLLIVVGVWAFMQHVQRIIPVLSKQSWWARLKHALPPVLTTAAMFIPGTFGDMHWKERFFVGLVLGLGIDKAHGLIKNTIFGSDKTLDQSKMSDEKKARLKRMRDTIT